MNHGVSLAEAQHLLRSAPQPFAEVFSRGTLKAELYAPQGTDDQTPHLQDEVYIVVSGSGTYVCVGESRPFGAGDLLFAAAGKDHHFENFSDDFAVWVIFYGPDGGEQAHSRTVVGQQHEEQA